MSQEHQPEKQKGPCLVTFKDMYIFNKIISTFTLLYQLPDIFILTGAVTLTLGLAAFMDTDNINITPTIVI